MFAARSNGLPNIEQQGRFLSLTRSLDAPWAQRLRYKLENRRSILVLAELLLYVRRKFTQTVNNYSHPSLRDYVLISLYCNRRATGIPSCTDCSCSERRRKRHNVWPDQLFTAVIGDEVSDESVPSAWPSSRTPATVVARFPSNDPLTQRGE
jgi:hypothetical protein